MKLQREILKQLSRLKADQWQREDGVCCNDPIWNYGPFSRAFAFWWLRFNGLIERKYIRHSIFESANSLPFYRLKAAGRAALAQEWPEPNIFGYKKPPTVNKQKICFPSVKEQQQDNN